MTQPIDWTGVREITERSRQTPGHPMSIQDQRMKTGADHARAYRNREKAKVARMADDNQNLREALCLALGYLIHSEPGDSRVVSDEFVAMAAVEAGMMNDQVMPIIRAATLALTKSQNRL